MTSNTRRARVACVLHSCAAMTRWLDPSEGHTVLNPNCRRDASYYCARGLRCSVPVLIEREREREKIKAPA